MFSVVGSDQCNAGSELDKNNNNNNKQSNLIKTYIKYLLLVDFLQVLRSIGHQHVHDVIKREQGHNDGPHGQRCEDRSPRHAALRSHARRGARDKRQDIKEAVWLQVAVTRAKEEVERKKWNTFRLTVNLKQPHQAFYHLRKQKAFEEEEQTITTCHSTGCCQQAATRSRGKEKVANACDFCCGVLQPCSKELPSPLQYLFFS